MQLTSKQKEKLNDFKNAYMMIFNKNNDKYMTFTINTIFENVEKNYVEFSDEISRISIEYENDKLNILKAENGYYSLLDFLLNRVFKNIEEIDFTRGENAYNYNNNIMHININRYDKYYNCYSSNGERLFPDDFLQLQKKKSIMHESGHAFQNKRECEFDWTLDKKQMIANELNLILGRKYNLNNHFENISDRFRVIPFRDMRNDNLGEGLDEMYASLFSGVRTYNLTSNSILMSAILQENAYKYSDGKTRSSFKKNCFNGYGHDKFFFLMRALVSKQSIFYSMYFGKSDMIDEFSNEFKEIIDKYEVNVDTNIKKEIPNYPGNFFVKLLCYVSYFYYHGNELGISTVYKYEKILYDIFLEAFEKKIGLLTVKNKLIENTLGYFHNDIMYVELENDWVDSKEKIKCRELYQRIKKVNIDLPEQQNNIQNTSNKNLNNNADSFCIFDVNVINNPAHNFKIIIYFKDNEIKIASLYLNETYCLSIYKLIITG